MIIQKQRLDDRDKDIKRSYCSSISVRSDFLIWLVALSITATVRRAILKCSASIALLKFAADDAVGQSDSKEIGDVY